MNEPVEHLPVAHLMQFSARLLVVSALHSCNESAFADLPYITRLSRDALSAVPDLRISVDASSGEPVQRLVQELASYVRHSASATKARLNATAKYVAAVDASAQNVDCDGCSQSQACSGAVTQEVVNQNVTRDGRCINAVAKLFNDACAFATWFMEKFGAHSARAEAPLRMSTVHTRKTRPHGIDGSNVALTARYEERERLVTLEVNTALFDELSFHVLPYLLLHELLCHAWDGAAIGMSPEPSDADAFAEGWMDHVALLVHNDWLERRFPRAPPPPTQAASRKAAAVNFHMQRRVLSDEPGVTSPARLRSNGAREAEHLMELLGDVAREQESPGEHARAWLYSLGAYLTLYRPPNRLAMAFWHPTPEDARMISELLDKSGPSSAWQYVERRIHDLLAT